MYIFDAKQLVVLWLKYPWYHFLYISNKILEHTNIIFIFSNYPQFVVSVNVLDVTSCKPELRRILTSYHWVVGWTVKFNCIKSILCENTLNKEWQMLKRNRYMAYTVPTFILGGIHFDNLGNIFLGMWIFCIIISKELTVNLPDQ